MSKLTAKQREPLKPSQFGLPDKARTKKARKKPGNYPMPDRVHAFSAVRLAKKHHKAGKLSNSDYRRIRRKAHKILRRTERSARAACVREFNPVVGRVAAVAVASQDL